MTETETPTLQFVYERQQAARAAQRYAQDLYWELTNAPNQPPLRSDPNQHPDVVAARKDADALALERAALREQVGGRVYRVVNVKLDELADRIAKLNKKAAKLGTDPITLTVSDETYQIVRKIALTDATEMAFLTGDFREEIIDFTFVTIAGPTPMIEGFVFVATLDHEADQGADEGVAIRRAPVGTGLVNQIGQEAANAVETIDLTAYRTAGPDCDHCGFNRRRNQTYVLYEVASGKLVQLGTGCVKDYIPGANSPERVAAWAEWLQALDSDLLAEGDDGFGDVSEGGGRTAIPTLTFLTHVATMTRTIGWKSRWIKTDYGEFERNQGATADRAIENIYAVGKSYFVAPTEADATEAADALDWVRDDLGERDELDEFQHNLVTYCRSNYLPAKGDGFVAYAIEARRREIEKALNAKLAATSEWIGEPKQRLKGLTFNVTFTKMVEGYYGAKQLTKGCDSDGNLLIWWASGNTVLEQGNTYELTATVKAHSTDSYQDDAKVTEITRVHGPSVKNVTVCPDCGEQVQPDPERPLSGGMICACVIAARAAHDAEQAAEAAQLRAEIMEGVVS